MLTPSIFQLAQLQRNGLRGEALAGARSRYWCAPLLPRLFKSAGCTGLIDPGFQKRCRDVSEYEDSDDQKKVLTQQQKKLC